ncbi:MAG: hypothetical protein AVDCRST_MAG95-2949, partial [uncultured Adhaeribacter sp.]
ESCAKAVHLSANNNGEYHKAAINWCTTTSTQTAKWFILSAFIG